MAIPNTQWLFVIVDVNDGSVTGTNDEKVARELSISEDCFVISMATCQVMTTTMDVGTRDPETDQVSDTTFENTFENIKEQTDYNL